MDDRFEKAALLMTDLVGDVYPDESHLELKSKCRHALNIAIGEVKNHFASVVKARSESKDQNAFSKCFRCSWAPSCTPKNSMCFVNKKG